MRRILLLLSVFILFSYPVMAQTDNPAPHPRLLAISVGDLDASIKWYENMLGFISKNQYSFPEDNMRLAFMENADFELELIEIEDTPSFDAPDPNNPATRKGFVKFAFYSGHIENLYKQALNHGAKVQSTLRKSNRTNGRYFILLDPDGNWIQVFGASS